MVESRNRRDARLVTIDLPGWETITSDLSLNGGVTITAKFLPEPTTCLRCGDPSGVKLWGFKALSYRDVPNAAEIVTVSVLRQRYRCRFCLATFFQPLPDIEEGRRMTKRCHAYVKERSLIDTFMSISQEVGIDAKTIRQIADAHIAHLDARYQATAPRILGIVEANLAGKSRLVLVDLEEDDVIELLEHCSYASIAQWTSSVTSSNIAEVVLIEEAVALRNALKRALPAVRVLSDDRPLKSFKKAASAVSIRLNEKGRGYDFAMVRARFLFR